MKKVLIVSYSNLNSDLRVLRQIEALKDNYHLETLAYSECGVSKIINHQIYKEPTVNYFRKAKRFLQFVFRNWENYYWDEYKKEVALNLNKNNYDIVISNDIQTLPLSISIVGGKGKVYFDAHEYHLLEFDNNLIWRLFHKPYIKFLCKKYIPKANKFSTVSNVIADTYKKSVGVKPFLLTNAASYIEALPNQVNPNNIKLIHHGASISSRKIELMIEMMKYVDDRYTLDLMLTDLDLKYLNKLKKLGINNTKIRFIPPVSSNMICTFINNYDIGIYILPPTNFNNEHALPNKFFEFIQARLAIIIAPTEEMKWFILKYELGLVSNDFKPKTVATLLNSLTPEQIMKFKINSHNSAFLLSAEENKNIIRNSISELLKS